MGRGDIASDLLELEARRRRGEPVNEFQSARIHAEFRLPIIIHSLKSGVPRSEVIGILAVVAQTSRRVACDALGKVLKKAKFEQLEEKVFPESPRANMEEARPSPRVERKVSKKSPSPQGEPGTDTPKVTEPVSAGPISAPAECVETSSDEIKEDVYKPDLVIGSGFHGYDDRPSEQDLEIRRKAQMNSKREPLSETIAKFRKRLPEGGAEGNEGSGIFDFLNEE